MSEQKVEQSKNCEALFSLAELHMNVWLRRVRCHSGAEQISFVRHVDKHARAAYDLFGEEYLNHPFSQDEWFQSEQGSFVNVAMCECPNGSFGNVTLYGQIYMLTDDYEKWVMTGVLTDKVFIRISMAPAATDYVDMESVCSNDPFNLLKAVYKMISERESCSSCNEKKFSLGTYRGSKVCNNCLLMMLEMKEGTIDCAVCLDQKQGYLVRGGCNHSFCVGCTVKTKEKPCPLCRAPA